MRRGGLETATFPARATLDRPCAVLLRAVRTVKLRTAVRAAFTRYMDRILVTGALGQIGSELVAALAQRHGPEAVVATDLRAGELVVPVTPLDVRDGDALGALVERERIGVVYHLASLLSATGERDPDLAWDVNVNGLKHVLGLARVHGLRIFWPSSIAVFGPSAPRESTPQHAPLEPSTIYGVTKVSGELLCRYYHTRFGVDVRSLRYPGLISYKTRPGGGTTDYAVEVFYAAVEGKPYTFFVGPDTRLPMMYMDDAIRATLELMDAASEDLTVRTSYNLGALSFTAEALAEAIRTRLPAFEADYVPDARQAIADSWPTGIDDAAARRDWGWAPAYDLDATVAAMLEHLSASTEAL